MEESRQLSLDLHGYRSDEAIREVTLFLERIRNAASRVPSLATSSSATFYVTIITGSGSHSSHGPILRSVVQRLLEKRGMAYQLERGGGAFRVDALSGHDLYQAGAPVDSKVVVVNDNDSFHQMASASRRRNPNERGSFANTVGIMQQQHQQQSRSTTQSSHRPMHTLSIPIADAAASRPSSYYYDPLPSQVAAEDKNVRTALEQSSKEINNLQRYRDQMERKHEEELGRAIEASRKSLSDANDAASQEREGQQSLLQLVSERSIADEEIRKEQAQREYEEELLKAIEQSLHLEQLKGEEDEEKNAEEYLMQKALAESEKIKTSEDELLQKILAESLMEQKRIEEEEEQMLRQAINDSSNVVVEANHKNELSAEEEELRRVIEMSKKDR